jgi:DNA-binding response OmpR family regulator
MSILVVDDDPQIVDALTVGFQLQWPEAEVIQAQDGQQALDAFKACDPDIILLDVTMPRVSGLAVLRDIRQTSDVPIIMLSARTEDADQVRALELGADDYIVKPFSHMALVARIKAILRRAQLPPPERVLPDFVAGDLTIDFQDHRVTLAGQTVHLTPVEYKLLYQLARNAGRVMPHQTLLDRVWGEDYLATTDHLKVFISRLRAKIERPGGFRFIETERGVGYRFVRPASRVQSPAIVPKEPLVAGAVAR